LRDSFEFEKCRQLFVGADDESLSVVAVRVGNEESSSVAIAPARPILEQAEQFEDDPDNDNYSDYVEDASIHAVD
jgi:hypothetical protein